MNTLGRTPPAAVRRQLRAEVRFGCPVADCGNPYLEYHHFAPQWHVRNHHDPEGMIALCAMHHAKADALTSEQCRELKSNPHAGDVKGRFEWMRREIVAVVGGNYYHETPNIVVYKGKRVVWVERDANGYMLLSLSMLSTSAEPRTSLIANDWEIRGEPEHVESPPNGSLLEIRYTNKDFLKIKFKEWPSADSIASAHPRLLALGDAVTYPLVTAEITMSVGGSDIRFDSKSTDLSGVFISGNVSSHCGSGLVID